MAETQKTPRKSKVKPVVVAKAAAVSRETIADTKKTRKVARKKPAAVTQKVAPVGIATAEGKKTMKNDATQAVTDRVQAMFGDVNEQARAAFEKNAKIVEELAELTRGNVEAIVASSKVAARGVEALGQEAAEYGRKSFEEASSADHRVSGISPDLRLSLTPVLASERAPARLPRSRPRVFSN